MSGSSILPDEAQFSDFKRQCLSTDNWVNKYDSDGMRVWVEIPPKKKAKNGPKVHKIKCQMAIKDVPAATMYDVLHDNQYRKTWDLTMSESYDIARLSANADVGYYSWICPNLIRNRDVVTLRSWKKYPPQAKYVRAVSIMTGYVIKSTGPNSCTFIYLSQADPKGSIPKVVVNKATQYLAPKVLRSVHKAGQNYQAWKEQNSPEHKPWLYPEQNTLPMMDPAELLIQRADSLENVDEGTKDDVQDSGEDSS
ncbi:START domain containing 14 isoform X2 [Nelusetta ayraudi]|uniref:START domain containing 14 isoform X2 n=1 Tax=Nelusetta ayraudi TaxID=303726 RepID=UPI003F70947D